MLYVIYLPILLLHFMNMYGILFEDSHRFYHKVILNLFYHNCNNKQLNPDVILLY